MISNIEYRFRCERFKETYSAEGGLKTSERGKENEREERVENGRAYQGWWKKIPQNIYFDCILLYDMILVVSSYIFLIVVVGFTA